MILAVAALEFKSAKRPSHKFPFAEQGLITLITDICMHPVKKDAEVTDRPPASVGFSPLAPEDRKRQIANTRGIEVLGVVYHGFSWAGVQNVRRRLGIQCTDWFKMRCA